MDRWEWRGFFDFQKYGDEIAFSHLLDKLDVSLIEESEVTDKYILVKKIDLNIKLRRRGKIRELQIKPEVKKKSYVSGYSKKISMSLPFSKNQQRFHSLFEALPSNKESIKNKKTNELVEYLFGKFRQVKVKKKKEKYKIKDEIIIQKTCLNLFNQTLHTISVESKSCQSVISVLDKCGINPIYGTNFTSYLKNRINLK